MRCDNLDAAQAIEGRWCELPAVDISGIKVTLFTVGELLEYILCAVEAETLQIITYGNVHTANLAMRLPWFRKFLTEDVARVFCDGFGLLLGARMLGHRITRGRRMTAPDFFQELGRRSAEKGFSMYLLAGRPGVSDLAIAKLKQTVPLLRVSGHHGYFEKVGPENEAVLQDINSKMPDILCLGFGSPLQERWIMENRARICAKVVLPLGAFLDFYTGTTWRGPRWLTDHGGEWFCRLITEPSRLWRRYLIGIPEFLFRLSISQMKSVLR